MLKKYAFELKMTAFFLVFVSVAIGSIIVKGGDIRGIAELFARLRQAVLLATWISLPIVVAVAIALIWKLTKKERKLA